MQVDLSKVKIDKEEQFVELVKQLNDEIKFRNIGKSKAEKETLLDLTYLLKRYRKLKYQEDRKAFRELYDCEYCFYYKKPERCPAIPKKGCPLESGKEIEKSEKKLICPKDREGDCPYGNDVGTCFGFCWKEILSEFYKEKRGRERE